MNWALAQFEKLFLKQPNPAIAYEIADLKIQSDDLTGARMKITYGLANSTDEMMHTYYDTQQPYQVSQKSAFTYLEGILIFRENPETNIDKAIAKLDIALASDPNFNLAAISKNALISRKEQTNKRMKKKPSKRAFFIVLNINVLPTFSSTAALLSFQL